MKKISVFVCGVKAGQFGGSMGMAREPLPPSIQEREEDKEGISH